VAGSAVEAIAVSVRFGPGAARSTNRWICANEPSEHPPVGDDAHDDAGLIADAVGWVVRLRQDIDIAAAPA
jgi:hypothetical protein